MSRPDRQQDYAFTVVSLGGADGAIAHVPGLDRPVRLAGGVPGDHGTLRLRHVGQHALWGTITALSVPSADRVEAPCPVVDQCGGCPWQMVSAAVQQQTRLHRVQAELQPWLPADAVTWFPSLSSAPAPRTRASVVVAQRKGQLHWGFYKPGTHDWLAVPGPHGVGEPSTAPHGVGEPSTSCHAHDPRVDTVLDRAVAVLGRAGVQAWDERRQFGQLQGLQVRLDPRTGQSLLTLVARRLDGLQAVATELLRTPGVQGVFGLLADRSGGPAALGRAVLLAGARDQAITWQALDQTLTMRLGPEAFVQTRHLAGETLIAAVATLLPEQMDHLLDLYAGVGVFGLLLRDRCARVTLAERDGPATDDARRHLTQHGLHAVEVRVGDAAETVQHLHGDGVTAAVVDPPRAGCGPAVVAALSALPQLQVVAYVSCGQAALRRDLADFIAHGWQAQRAVLVDLFADTPHVEVAVQLTRALA